MEKDPPAVDPLQPLHLSCSADRVTYVNSLLAPNEMKLLESEAPAEQRRLCLNSFGHARNPSICNLTSAQHHTFLTTLPLEDLTFSLR